MDLSFNQNANLKMTPQVTPQVTPQETVNIGEEISQKHMELLEYCETARSREEMMSFVELKDRNNFTKNYINPLLSQRLIAMTIPDKPKSSQQKYIRVNNN